MSTLWSLFVIAGTAALLVGCYVLLVATRRAEVDDGEHKTKDHSFDGITELETPLPRWWYYAFVGSILFAAIYLVLYPGLGSFGGVLGWSQEQQWSEEVERAEARYAPLFDRYAAIPLPELVHEPQALRMGQRIFGNFCAQCHGSAAQGAFGFPNLTDASWIWGGAPDQIKTSIVQGRLGAMPGWEAALGDAGIADTTQYVLSLTDRATDSAAVQRGKAHYDLLCVACHTADGTGMISLGAPNLTDDVWLYGGSAEQIAFTLRHGRQGVMPAHADIIDERRIHLVAAYVYSLSRTGERTSGGDQTGP